MKHGNIIFFYQGHVNDELGREERETVVRERLIQIKSRLTKNYIFATADPNGNRF